MATLSQSESRRKYSWWWDSHIPKNSKWLQDNLTDMDSKVKAMIKLIEEDADSFARRAEMYYKKRPELMKLVEEFYRAYRALAERYDHATMELRHAHKTMSEAFPNQVPFVLADELTTGGSSGPEFEPLTPEMPNPMRAFFDSDDLQKEYGISKRGLKQLNEIFEFERVGKAETEVGFLKESIIEIQSEKEDVLLRYQQSLNNTSSLERDLNEARKRAGILDERASEAEIEIKVLKETLSKFEAERDAGLHQYKQCLDLISSLENKISLAEENAKMLNEQIERAESEIKALKDALVKVEEEKDIMASRYEKCLETIAELESELCRARDDAKRLNGEIVISGEKLRSVEEQHDLVERSNRSLLVEADNLVKKIAIKDRELSDKQKEFEKLQSSLQEEHLRFVQVEATLQTLHKLNSRSQEEQRGLTSELLDKVRKLKELEACNDKLEEELRRVQGENRGLDELNSSSSVSIKNLEGEILSLKEVKERLESEVFVQIERSNILQQEVDKLKDEIEVLSSAYQALMNELREENSKLKEECGEQRGEIEVVYQKLRDMDELLEKNVVLRSSISELNGKLEGSRELVEELQKSIEILRGEKCSLGSEKSTLLCQLQIMTENMKKLLEKNTLLECSLSGANIELEGLRSKSKTLEEFCQYLKTEKSNLAGERDSLISKLENVEKRLCILEFRFVKLEEKYSDMEKEKESTLVEVEELRDSLGAEQLERACYVQSSESRLADLENHVRLLQEESRFRKKEFEEEIDKSVKAQVEIFVFQKFVKELEEKNLFLLIECKKHVEASKLSDKLIRELERENLEQQIEGEFLLDEIEKLRSGIYLVFRALQLDRDVIESDQVPLSRILDNVEDIKGSLLRNQEEKQQLVVENSVLLTLIGQLEFEGSKIASERRALEYNFEISEKQNAMLHKENQELLEMNRQLKLDVRVGKMEHSNQLAENRLLLEKFSDIEEDIRVLEDENSIAIQETVALSSLSCFLETFGLEKALEVAKLEGKLVNKEAENLHMNETIENLHEKLRAVEDLNEQLNYQLVIGNDLLRQKTVEFSEADEKLQAAYESIAELNRSHEELKMEYEESKRIREKLKRQIVELSEDSKEHQTKIEHLCEENDKLSSEVVVLHKEIEEQKMHGEDLNLELQERSNEFELWEAEASSFYFDFQASAISEALLENKVHELTQVCGSLEEESAVKSAQLGQMKERVDDLESEIGGLKVQMAAYVPVIASLRDSITSLEHNALLQPKLRAPDNDGDKDVKTADELHETSYEELEEGQGAFLTAGISDLQEMHTRLKSVEKAVVEEMNRLSKQKTNDNNNVIEASPNGIEHPYQETEKDTQVVDEHARNLKSKKILLKDIPLDEVSDSSSYRKSKKETGTSNDEMLELWESAEHECGIDSKLNDMRERAIVPGETISEQRNDCSLGTLVEKELSIDKLEISSSIRKRQKGVKNRKILDRLASDAHKLTTLQATVKQLKKRMEIKKNSKAFDLEYGQVKEQLQEVDDAIAELLNVSSEMSKDVERSRASFSSELEEHGNVDLKKVRERAQKGSEKIGRLQFEVQSIEYVMLKLEDEKKSKGKNRAGILLRDFIYSGGRRTTTTTTGRRKKGCFCGCGRPSTSVVD